MRTAAHKNFGGLDQRIKYSESLATATEMKNFRITDDGALEKRQELITVLQNEDFEIEGIWYGSLGDETFLLFAANRTLYRIDTEINPYLYFEVGKTGYGEVIFFKFNNFIYYKSLDYYGRYDGSSCTEVEGYIPLVALSCLPSGEGETFEQLNLLTNKRRQLFSADGKANEFVLAEKGITEIVEVKLDGAIYTGLYSIIRDGTVYFDVPPHEGLNNLEITYKKEDEIDYAHFLRFFRCTNAMVFGGNSDGRVFLWGNEHYQNYRFHSDLANGVPSAEYFPVNAYTIIGNDTINCIVQQYDRQLIFTKNEAFYSYSELINDGLGNTKASFPVANLNSGKGCLFKTDGCVVDNRPITLCDDGLNMWESTSIENEKNAVCFSKQISEALVNPKPHPDARLLLFDFQANREMFFIAGNTAYIYNYGNGTWYYYEIPEILFCSAHGKSLYLADRHALYLYTPNNEAKESSGCVWKSGYINNGHFSGALDVIKCEADIFTNGENKLTFTAVDNCGNEKTRKFLFDGNAKGFKRIMFRPSLKRKIPFYLKIEVTGKGDFRLNSLTLQTRSKERSNRNGIL